MASVFAYEPDPPKIASPWLGIKLKTNSLTSAYDHEQKDHSQQEPLLELGGLPLPPLESLPHGVCALDPEPELGPVEYKLHLLLRQRQALAALPISDPRPDTNNAFTGNPRLPKNHGRDAAAILEADTSASIGHSQSHVTTSAQSRQQRLTQLTTQLLWRLKQSSPYHAFSGTDTIVPRLPTDSGARLVAPTRQEKLLPGLEESQGAMYEIGVADDGSFVGLTRDELDESLTNLRAMAASLGCKVSILRVVVVKFAEQLPYYDPEAPEAGSTAVNVHTQALPQLENLYVVEAIVLPDTDASSSIGGSDTPLPTGGQQAASRDGPIAEKSIQMTEQLRVSLTGSTTSGKSTLLGTLLASTFDDARGKSRLNLLKHRHEIASGMTSSVAHELLGYQRHTDAVVNYAYHNVDSWTDVHDTAEGGRLVLLIDSAGHPRFRRTILRNLIAWQPHWTLCCISAMYQTDGDPSALNTETFSPAQMRAIAHLQLCLRLNLPLVVVITKSDLARAALRQTLGYILTIVKAAGRQPLSLHTGAPVKSEEELRKIPDGYAGEISAVIEEVKKDARISVPIVLVSAVNGMGITKLHALLRQLPIPNVSSSHEVDNATTIGESAFAPLSMSAPASASEHPAASTLFDIDDTFEKDVAVAPFSHGKGESHNVERTFLLSGLLRRGTVAVGDTLLLGPFSVDSDWPSQQTRPPLDMRRTASYPVTYHELSMRRHAKLEVRRRRSSEDVSESQRPSRVAFSREVDFIDSPAEREPNDAIEEQIETHASEWIRIRITSVRNLRLPVRKIFADQCATIGFSVVPNSTGPTERDIRPRKGMVLINARNAEEDATQIHDLSRQPATCSAFHVLFTFQDYHAMEPGAQFIIYVSSVRALVKVVTVGLHEQSSQSTYKDGNYRKSKADGDSAHDNAHELEGDDDDQQVFHLDDAMPEPSVDSGPGASDTISIDGMLDVLFQLVNGREYIEVGAKIFVMPGQASEGGAVLNGYVGIVNDVM